MANPRDDGQRAWSIGGADARAVLRPDGRWALRLPAGHEDLWLPLLDRVRDEISEEVLVNATDESGQGSILAAAGFVPLRREQVWSIPLPVVAARSFETGVHRLISVRDAQLDRVTALDNQIRHAIPGTRAWEGSVEELRATLADEEFDPALYLIAENALTGSYDGLIRVWWRQPLPRLGCVGVVPQWRRTRLAPMLLTSVARTLVDRGVAVVTTETDFDNRDSFLLAEHFGGERLAVNVEWQLGTQGGRVPALP